MSAPTARPSRKVHNEKQQPTQTGEAPLTGGAGPRERDAGGDVPSDLPLPHERDESTGQTAKQPDPVIRQAKRDLDAGQVDTDMWATPGLDAARRDRMVPTPPESPKSPDSSKPPKTPKSTHAASAGMTPATPDSTPPRPRGTGKR